MEKFEEVADSLIHEDIHQQNYFPIIYYLKLKNRFSFSPFFKKISCDLELE